MALSRPQTHNTCSPEMGIPWSSNGPRGPFQLPQKPKMGLWARFFNVPENGRKTSLKMRGTHFEKVHFCNVHFSMIKKQIREKHASNKMHFLVGSLGDLEVFSYFQVAMFFRPQQGGTNQEKSPPAPKNCRRPRSDPRSGPQRAPFRKPAGHSAC